jgi:hypothetical protein
MNDSDWVVGPHLERATSYLGREGPGEAYRDKRVWCEAFTEYEAGRDIGVQENGSSGCCGGATKQGCTGKNVFLYTARMEITRDLVGADATIRGTRLILCS